MWQKIQPLDQTQQPPPAVITSPAKSQHQQKQFNPNVQYVAIYPSLYQQAVQDVQIYRQNHQPNITQTNGAYKRKPKDFPPYKPTNRPDQAC